MLLLAGLGVFLTFPQVILGSRSFFYRDFGSFGYPLAYYFKDSLFRGELPLWNPLSYCGAPFLAQWNTLVLYPGSLLYLVLPLPWSLSVFCLLHQVLAACGMFVLCRHWVRQPVAAAVAGLVFAFNGLTASALMWPSLVASLGWMPWVVWAMDLAWTGRRRALLRAAVIGTLQMLSGTPEVILFTWLVIGLRGLALVLGRQLGGMSAVARLAPVVLLISGLSAVQLLPFLDLLAHSERSSSYGGDIWAMPGTGWGNFLVPLFRAVPAALGVFFQPGQEWISSYYVGVLTVLLAGSTLLARREVWPRLLGALCVVSLILALGKSTVFYRWLSQDIHLLGWMRFPVKFAMVATFALPVLAAYGIADLRERTGGLAAPLWRQVMLLALGILVVMAGLVFFGVRFPWVEGRFVPPYAIGNALGRAAFLLLSLAALAFWTRPSHRPRTQRLAEGCVLVLVWVDLLTHAPNQNPTVDPQALEPGLVKFERPAVGSPDRAMLSSESVNTIRQTGYSDSMTDFLRTRLALFGNLNLLDGVAKMDGGFAVRLRHGAFLQILFYGTTNQPSSALLDFLGVSRVTESGKLISWTNRPTAMTLFTAGQRPVYANDAEAFRRVLARNFDPRAEVILPAGRTNSAQFCRQAKVQATRVEPHRLEADVETPEPVMVVVSQTYYHPWRAYLDGQPVPLWRANYGFQAVETPAGRHQLKLAYEDNAFRLGGLLSLLSLAACAVLWRGSSAAPLSDV